MSKYVSNVHAKPQKSGRVENEIKRTMKASRIQRDVVSQFWNCALQINGS